MRNGLFFFLAFAGFGCLIAAAITNRLWLAVGFFVFGGLMFVLFPRRSAGDPDHDVGRYSWVLPKSQPARTIGAFVLGLVCLGMAAVAVLK